MRTTNIWSWDNCWKRWEVRHHDVPKHAAAYWLNRYRDEQMNAGREKPILRAQIKAPKPLVICIDAAV